MALAHAVKADIGVAADWSRNLEVTLAAGSAGSQIVHGRRQAAVATSAAGEQAVEIPLEVEIAGLAEDTEFIVDRRIEIEADLLGLGAHAL